MGEEKKGLLFVWYFFLVVVFRWGRRNGKICMHEYSVVVRLCLSFFASGRYSKRDLFFLRLLFFPKVSAAWDFIKKSLFLFLVSLSDSFHFIDLLSRNRERTNVLYSSSESIKLRHDNFSWWAFPSSSPFPPSSFLILLGLNAWLSFSFLSLFSRESILQKYPPTRKDCNSSSSKTCHGLFSFLLCYLHLFLLLSQPRNHCRRRPFLSLLSFFSSWKMGTKNNRVNLQKRRRRSCKARKGTLLFTFSSIRRRLNFSFISSWIRKKKKNRK